MASRPTWKFRNPTEADIRSVAANMRAADRLELVRSSGQTPEWGLRHSVAVSDVAYALELSSGEVGAIFGATRSNLVESEAVVWALSSNAVNARKVEYARASKAGLDLLSREMPDVGEFVNLMDAEYEAAVRWVEWLGGAFAMHGARPGAFGGVFRLFYISNPHYKEG